MEKNHKNNLMKRILTLLLAAALQMTVVNAGGLFRIVDGLNDNDLRTILENNVNALMVAMNTAAVQGNNIKTDKKFITPEAVKELKAVWKSSAMTIPPVNIMSKCLRTSHGYQVRGIPVDVKEADTAEQRQELAIDFLPDGRISSVNIAIEMHRYDQIMAEQSGDLDYARRQIIVDFVENFRTAYNRRDLQLLNNVFSDKALIITGKVVSQKKGATDIDRLTLNTGNVVYIKQTKQEYLKKLEGVFKAVKFLNVKFDEIEVVQHPKYDDIYGVTLKQYWHSNIYSDEGYLFLMIDFRDADKPLIQVRTWQPYKNDDGKVLTAKKDVYHLGSFRIVR